MPKQSITLTLSMADIEDLTNGEVFNWSIESDTGETIVVIIRQETESDLIDEPNDLIP